MRRAVVACLCAAWMAVAAPAALAQAPANGQLAVVLKDRIVAVNADGSAQRSLYTPAGAETITDPAWSPEGNRIAFSYQRKIVVLDVATREARSVSDPGADGRDSEPAWSADGRTLGFHRVRGLVHQRVNVPAGGGTASTATLDVAPDALALAPDLTAFAFRIAGVLAWTGGGLDLSVGAADTPAWSRANDLAYVETGELPWPSGLRVLRNAPAQGPNVKITDLPVEKPRWAPAGDQLVFLRDGGVLTVPAVAGSAPVAVPGVTGATAVDWQPCTAQTSACRSVLAPTCTTPLVQLSTLADQPVELPAPPCTDPAGLALQLQLVKDGDHGTLSGTRYTPRSGFVGLDTLQYRVSNGSAQSDLVRVTINVVARPAAVVQGPAPAPATPVLAAPYLSLRERPRLDRRRTTVARLSCDQACSFSVRLDGRLRSKGKRVRGTVLKRTLAPGRVLALRLKLPAKPKGTLKTVTITGTVRGANGATRAVKLPVSVRR